ncbi:major facilitator superfamily protein [Apiospora rasikravindrae]|uniref:Major facilitator superfamily protein n=1 Tax=Apiospora rasikravindrae TaxID=990691 RepID=A0ABR1TWN8_9PEZI
MGVLALTSLLTSLEATITSTVLPVIISDLNGGSAYIWVANAYFLTMASLQPLFGQIANVFGRRWPMIFSAAAFVLGSGICGGATNMTMLITGRVIQGIGGSGISVLCETIICDLVPLRERGTYMAAVLGMVALGTSTWRWAFYLALPIGGPALVLLFFFLHVNYDRSSTLATNLGRLDWLGNAVFVGASSSVLIALSWAGSEYPWSSSQVLAPLLVGAAGLAGFLLLEACPRLAPNPMMPLHLFASRTTSAVFAITFLHGVVTIWALYFLPVYFQGVLGASPYRSGVMLLPTILPLIPAAIAGGLLLSHWGRYKPLLIVALALITLGFGLFSLLDENPSTGAWVGFQIIQSLGAGLAIPTLLPALLAPLSDADTALATGTWAFMRSFGVVWGVAIAGTVFSNRAAALAPAAISADAKVAAEFAAGGAYQDATAQFLDMLSAETRAQVVVVQSWALQRSWQVAIAFGLAGFIVVVALLKEIPLRKELDSEFGMTEQDKSKKEAGGVGAPRV